VRLRATRLTAIAHAARRAMGAWSPLSWFAAGEQGAWYDPTDLTRYMGALGPELVTNGDFSSGTAGTIPTGATISVVGGELEVNVTTAWGFARHLVSGFVVGRSYLISGVFRAGSVTTARVQQATMFAFAGTTSKTNVAFSSVWVATSTTLNLEFDTQGAVGTAYFDNISVRELTAINTATMYQDAAGTTPVTAVEQPVGLILDRRLGAMGALGPELVSNGDGSAGTTGWVPTAATQAVVSGEFELTATSAGAIQTNFQIPTVAGRTYRVTATARRGTCTQPVYVGLNGVGAALTTSTTNVALSALLTATGNFTNVQVYTTGASVGQTLYFDNVSAREVPGNHASQATSTARPTLRNRYNLLTFTEQFDNAAWPRNGVTVTANAAVSPDGSLTADKIVETAAAGFHSINPSTALPANTLLRVSISLKKAERSFVRISDGIANTVAFNLDTGVATTVAGSPTGVAMTATGDGWYRCTLSFSAASAPSVFVFLMADSATLSYTGDGTSGVFAWGASVTTAADASLPYQRVTTATDYDSDPAKFPLRLNADGIDDAMSLATLGTLNPTAGAFELFVAFRYVNVDTDSASAWLNDSILSDAGGWASPIYARSSGHIGASGGTSNGQKIELATDIRARHVWHARLAGGQLTVSLDGGPEQSIACGNWGSTAGVMRLFQSMQGFAEVHLHELIFRDGAVSAGDRASAISYLKTRWGVA